MDLGCPAHSSPIVLTPELSKHPFLPFWPWRCFCCVPSLQLPAWHLRHTDHLRVGLSFMLPRATASISRLHTKFTRNSCPLCVSRLPFCPVYALTDYLAERSQYVCCPHIPSSCMPYRP